MCKLSQDRSGYLGRSDSCTKQPISQYVGSVARCLAADDEIGQTPQILHEHDSNCNCESP